jgi:hypothetical protein
MMSKCNNKFERVFWLTNREKRIYIVDDLINSNILIGLSKYEIIDYLGDEFNDINSDKWNYFLGYRIPSLSIFEANLYLFFDDKGLVKKVFKK